MARISRKLPRRFRDGNRSNAGLTGQRHGPLHRGIVEPGSTNTDPLLCRRKHVSQSFIVSHRVKVGIYLFVPQVGAAVDPVEERLRASRVCCRVSFATQTRSRGCMHHEIVWVEQKGAPSPIERPFVLSDYQERVRACNERMAARGFPGDRVCSFSPVSLARHVADGPCRRSTGNT